MNKDKIINEIQEEINKQKKLASKQMTSIDKLQECVDKINNKSQDNPQVVAIDYSLQKKFNVSYVMCTGFVDMYISHKKQKEVVVRIPIEYYPVVSAMNSWWYAYNDGKHHVYCSPNRYKTGRYEYSLLDYIYGCGHHVKIEGSSLYEIFSSDKLEHVTNCVRDLLQNKNYVTLNTIENKVTPKVLTDKNDYAIFIDFTKLTIRKKV